MDSYWREGLDLEDEAVLAAAARKSGLDPGAALGALSAPGILARVDGMAVEAARAGVTGIPTFGIAGRRVVGAQPYEVLSAEAEAAGARRRA